MRSNKLIILFALYLNILRTEKMLHKKILDVVLGVVLAQEVKMQLVLNETRGSVSFNETSISVDLPAVSSMPSHIHRET